MAEDNGFYPPPPIEGPAPLNERVARLEAQVAGLGRYIERDLIPMLRQATAEVRQAGAETREAASAAKEAAAHAAAATASAAQIDDQVEQLMAEKHARRGGVAVIAASAAAFGGIIATVGVVITLLSNWHNIFPQGHP